MALETIPTGGTFCGIVSGTISGAHYKTPEYPFRLSIARGRLESRDQEEGVGFKGMV